MESRAFRSFGATVVVIGSGAGGAVAASELARAGVDTLLLEAGPHHDPGTFDQREGSMMDRLYEEGGMRFSRDQSLLLMSGRGLGGSTVHNTALCVPPPSAILERWERVGALADRGTLERAVSEVLETIGARPPEDSHVNRSNQLLEDGAKKLGLETVRPLTSRTACSGCGHCILGCAYNRKRNVLFSHLSDGAAAGLRIVTESPVTRIRPKGGDGFRITGPGLEARCRRVVVAASALGTPVLLQRSGLGARRHVGRSLRVHPFAPVAGVFEEPVDAHRGIPQSVLVTGTATFMNGGEGGCILMSGAAGPAGTGALIRGGAGLLPRVMARWRHLAVAGVLLHDATRGRVTGRRDGLPSVRYWPKGRDVREMLDGISVCARIQFAAGARMVLLPFSSLPEVHDESGLEQLSSVRFRPYDVALTSVHPQGTVPMGGTRDGSAVDPKGRLWTNPGVRIADGSLFPSSVGVPPQVTIMALATIIARDLASELS